MARLAILRSQCFTLLHNYILTMICNISFRFRMNIFSCITTSVNAERKNQENTQRNCGLFQYYIKVKSLQYPVKIDLKDSEV